MNLYEYLKGLRGRDDLSDSEYRLLVDLATYSNGDLTNARPGFDRLAADLCHKSGTRSVRRTARSLQARGYLVVAAVGGAPRDGQRTANVYALALPATEGPHDPGSDVTTEGPQDPGSEVTEGPHDPGSDVTTEGPQDPGSEVTEGPQDPRYRGSWGPGTEGPQDPPTKSLPIHNQPVRVLEPRETADEKRRNQERQLKALEERMAKEAG